MAKFFFSIKFLVFLLKKKKFSFNLQNLSKKKKKKKSVWGQFNILNSPAANLQKAITLNLKYERAYTISIIYLSLTELSPFNTLTLSHSQSSISFFFMDLIRASISNFRPI